MGAVTSSADEERIRQRYPGRSPVDVAIGVVAGLAVLAAIVLVVITGLQRSNPPVAGMVRGFDVQSPTLTVADIVIQRKDPAQAAECFVFAQAVTFERVGELVVKIPPGSEVLTSMDVPIATIKEATSISLENCRIVD